MTAATKRPAKAGTRTTWGILDQLVWSFGNVVLTVLVSSSVSGADFGRFSAVFAVVLVVAGSSGALCFEPLVMVSADDRSRSQPIVVRLGVTIGVGASALMAASALLFPDLTDVLLLLALGLPAYVAMEVLRGTLTYSGNTRLLFWLDVLWTVLSALLLLVGRQFDASIGALGLIWCAAAIPSITLGVLLTRPDVTLDRREVLPNTRRFGPSFLYEYLVSSGIAQLVPIVVAIAATFEAAAELRLIQVAFGPVTALFAGIRVVAMPQLRDHHRAGGDLRRTVIVIVSSLAATTIAYGAVLSAFNGPILEKVFGDAWPAAALLLPIAIGIRLCNALSLGAILVARITEHIVGSRRIRIAVGAVMLIGSYAGALVNGSQGAILGLLAAQIFGVVAWYTLIRDDITATRGISA